MTIIGLIGHCPLTEAIRIGELGIRILWKMQSTLRIEGVNRE